MDLDLNPPMNCSFGDSYHYQGLESDSLSLQEMIDNDIKTEFDDIHCGNMSGHFSNMDNFELFHDLDLKMDDEMMGWSGPWSLGSRNSDHLSLYESNSPALSNNCLEDMTRATSVMVNPSSVMPIQASIDHKIYPPTSSTTIHIASHSSSASKPQIINHTPVILTQTPMSNCLRVKSMKILPPQGSPLQQVPSTMSMAGPTNATTITTSVTPRKKPSPNNHQIGKENGFPKPAYSYSCLIALALKNSHTRCMSVSEIYKFMCEHFPYFKTAPSGWKNSVRHNLSLNKCFEKIEKPASNANQRKGCLWAMNPAKITKMEEELAKWSRKDPMGIKKGMLMPENLESLERGQLVKDYTINTNGLESEDDEDPRTPTSVSSQGSQGYDSAGSDFVDVETFPPSSEASLHELNLQVSGGIFEEIETSNFLQANYTIIPDPISTPNMFNTIIIQKQDRQKIFCA